jgi:hypothetical protein
MRPGKERASSPDQHEAPDTAIAPDDARWLNGVHRQMQPDAPSQRQAASRAASAKRTANAMSEEERKLKDAERNRQKRAKKAAEKAAAAEAARETAQAKEAAAAEATAAAAAAADAAREAANVYLPTLYDLNMWRAADEPVLADEWCAFKDWAQWLTWLPEDCKEEAVLEHFSKWRNSHDYQSCFAPEPAPVQPPRLQPLSVPSQPDPGDPDDDYPAHVRPPTELGTSPRALSHGLAFGACITDVRLRQ